MSVRDRQRRLHVENRLAELNAKFGPVDDTLPDWLDHLIEPAPVETADSPPPPELPPPAWHADAIDLSRYG